MRLKCFGWPYLDAFEISLLFESQMSPCASIQVTWQRVSGCKWVQSAALDIVNGSFSNLCALALGLALNNFITQYWWVHPNKDEIAVRCCDTALSFPVMLVSANVFKRFEKCSLNFSISSFAVPVNPFHPQPSLFLHGLLLSLWCFSIFVKYYFQLSFNLK